MQITDTCENDKTLHPLLLFVSRLELSTYQLLYVFQLLLQVNLFQDSHTFSSAAVSVNVNLKMNRSGSHFKILQTHKC